jgi:hypothetical protein
VELEQRIKSLEYEMKILKNEIQRTLLDIQEQVLIHYYPALRTEEPAQGNGSRPAPEGDRGRSAPAPSSALVARKVSLDEIRAAQSENAAAGPRSNGGADQTTAVRLSEWVSSHAPKIGGASLGKIVEACAGRGLITPQTQALMLRLASLHGEAAPGKVNVNDVVTALLKLNELLGRAADLEEALSLIEEAGLG